MPGKEVEQEKYEPIDLTDGIDGFPLTPGSDIENPKKDLN